MKGYVRIAEMHDLHGQLCIKLVEYSHYEEHVNPEVELHTRPNVKKMKMPLTKKGKGRKSPFV